MRILCVTPWFPSTRTDPFGSYILDSIESVAALDHEMIVLASQPWRPSIAKLLKPEWHNNEIQKNEFSIPHIFIKKYLSIPRSYCLNFSNWSYRIRIGNAIRRLSKQFQFDVIHAHTELAAVPAVDVGRQLGIPTVVTLHGISTEQKLYQGKARRLYYDYALTKANQVVLVGRPLLEFFKNYIPLKNRSTIIPNGFRVTEKNPAQRIKHWPNSTFRFISVSLLQEGKGIDLNLKALAHLNQIGNRNWTYQIVGDGPERSHLQTLVQTLHLESQVTFTGACAHHEVFTHLNNADVFILPSYREAFGIAYLEAMSCGLLAIGVKGQGAEEFITHEKTGLLVEGQNVDNLANQLQHLCQARERMKVIAEAGKQFVHGHFTWQEHAKKLEALYFSMTTGDDIP